MTLQRCILTLDSKEKSERTSDWVDVAHTETSDVELVRMIERRSRKGEAHPEELEPSYMESVRRHNDRRREEMRTAWASYHEGQAASHRATLRALVEHHEHEAAKLMDVQTERSRVSKVRRAGGGWLGRAATPRRMRSRGPTYQGSQKTRGPANRGPAPSWARSAQPWAYGKAWR